MNLIKNPKNTVEGNRFPCFFNAVAVFLCLCIFFSLLSLTINLFVKDSLAQEIKSAIIDERMVIGTGEIFDKNVALARNKAISQAFLKSIQEYLVQRLGPRIMANNFQRLDEEIISEPKAEIQDYQIISVFSTDRYVKVLMKVRVNKAILEKKLERMKISEIDTIPISVLFLVSEKKEDLPAIYWWGDPANQTSLIQTEVFLSQVFEDRGFRVVNRSFPPPEESYDESMLHLSLTNEAAAKWGKLLSALIVITGEANLHNTSKATIFFKAVKVADGTVVAQAYREGILNSNLTDGQSAIELAINNWANDTIPYIIEAVQVTQEAINQVIVTIKGIKNYREFLYLKEFLRTNFPEIKSISERRLKKDSVKISVEVKENSKELSEKILNHLKRPFSFEINELNDKAFTLVIK